MAAITQSWATTYGFDLPWVFWAVEDTDLDHDEGVRLECKLKVTSSETDDDSGVVLAIFTNPTVWLAWLRETSCNVHGATAVTWTLNDRPHWISFRVRGNEAKLYVDDNLVAYGGPAGSTTSQGIGHGSWVSPEFVI